MLNKKNIKNFFSNPLPVIVIVSLLHFGIIHLLNIVKFSIATRDEINLHNVEKPEISSDLMLSFIIITIVYSLYSLVFFLLKRTRKVKLFYLGIYAALSYVTTVVLLSRFAISFTDMLSVKTVFRILLPGSCVFLIPYLNNFFMKSGNGVVK